MLERHGPKERGKKGLQKQGPTRGLRGVLRNKKKSPGNPSPKPTVIKSGSGQDEGPVFCSSGTPPKNRVFFQDLNIPVHAIASSFQRVIPTRSRIVQRSGIPPLESNLFGTRREPKRPYVLCQRKWHFPGLHRSG